MYYGPTSPEIADEVKARLEAMRARDAALLAARMEALRRSAAATTVVALSGLAILLAIPGRATITAVAFFGIFAGGALAIYLLRSLPFRLRAVLFTLIQFGAGFASLIVLGPASAGWLYFITCAVLATMFFGTRGGVITGLLVLASWAGFVRLFLPPALPPADWLIPGINVATLMASLIWPMRQFFDFQAATTAKRAAEPAAT